MEFEIKVPTSKAKLKNLFSKATREGKKEGVTIEGDLKKGSFEGSTIIGGVEGTYKVSNGRLKIEVTKKPFLLSEALVKKVITEFFEE